MNTSLKMAFKVLALVALVAVYFFVAGTPGWETLFGRKLAVVYGAGAVIALWGGGQPTGTLQPVSLRPVFITVGILLMLAVFVVMFTTRDFTRELRGNAPNQVLQRTRPDVVVGNGFARARHSAL